MLHLAYAVQENWISISFYSRFYVDIGSPLPTKPCEIKAFV